jgi:hypothetical protein
MATSAAWYAFHYAPRWLQAGMDVYTFLVEVPVPWLLLTSGWPRLLAALLIGAMHIGIAVLGNFGTFQLVSVVLCVACISDQQWRVAIAWLRRRPQVARAGVRCEPAAHAARGWRRYVRRLDCALASGVAATAMLCGLLYTVRMMQPQGTTLLSNTRWLFVPEAELSMGYFGSQLMRATAPFFLSYPYGIFRDKPDVKLGMVFQGSSDGEHWNIYPNKLNAVEPIDRPPPFFAPYQPRLDHMFLYEAGDFHFAFVNGINPYYGAIAPLPFLTQRLFERSGDVLALFANDPLRGKTPTLLRARRARYRFTTPNERARSGDWWVRDMESILGPVDMATTLKMTETLRANARRALKHALEVDERLRPSGPAPALAYNSDAWMPPWRFWLCVLPGVLPAAWRGWRRWRLRTVAALPRQLASTSGQPGDAAGP